MHVISLGLLLVNVETHVYGAQSFDSAAGLGSNAVLGNFYLAHPSVKADVFLQSRSSLSL